MNDRQRLAILSLWVVSANTVQCILALGEPCTRCCVAGTIYELWREDVGDLSLLGGGDLRTDNKRLCTAQAAEALWQVLTYMDWGGAALSTELKSGLPGSGQLP